MTAICTRLIAFAGATPNPRTETQVALVQGVVAVRLDPRLIAVEEGNVTPNPDFWDVLVAPTFDKSPYVVLYEAEMQDDGSIVVKRDLFGPGDYPHSWAGWPIPGDEALPPAEDPAPPTLVLTPAQEQALDAVRKARLTKGGKP